MSKIRILPEQLANQIAAGEVVERPASVVKELVENSLDAGSDRIEVEIEGGGTRLIRVIDNGQGMDEDDLLLSLERHGTSKIQNEQDLGSINTLGFRGEAIPSIGSVSKMTLTSRVADSPLGTRVVLEYGKLTKVHETGCSLGTTIEVRNLFGNTPARKKFLRTTRTEIGHIEEIVKNYALATTKATFILRVDGRESLYLDQTLSLKQRLAAVMRFKGDFLPVTSSGGNSRHLKGFLVPPEQVSVGPSRLRLFVNGRAIRDRMFTHAIAEGLRGFLMKGKNPAGLFCLEIPPDEVDVNVHPAKQEIRFRNGRDVHLFISSTIQQAMADHQQQIKSVLFGKDKLPDRQPVPIWGQQDSEDVVLPRSENPAAGDTAPSASFPPEEKTGAPQDIGAFGGDKAFRLEQDKSSDDVAPCPVSAPVARRPQPKKLKPAVRSIYETAEPMPGGRGASRTQEQRLPSPPHHGETAHNLQVIGQLDNLYIFCKGPEGLVVIDQHAAHERLLFEKLRRQFLERRVVSQTLMFPETVELSVFQAELALKNSEEIARIGFAVREFGGNTFIISAVPAVAGTISPTELFLDVLEKFGSEKESSGGGLLDNILANMACKAAVKAGTPLSAPEIDRLLNDMARADLFSHCPHGRPVMRLFFPDEMKKWFYRT
ncbi:DNA mismatch repair endonuclease MutL [Desulforhopalus singaporensis]|nr:DNA mismatch repair endonuclease MutL [Desulforhopalus singaporensis]